MWPGTYETPGAVSFQVIFYENNTDVLMQYKDVSFDDPSYDNGCFSHCRNTAQCGFWTAILIQSGCAAGSDGDSLGQRRSAGFYCV